MPSRVEFHFVVHELGLGVGGDVVDDARKDGVDELLLVPDGRHAEDGLLVAV